MCPICDGMTQEELLIDTHERVQRFGFTVSGIEPDPDHPSWLYTVGLVQYDHPEVAILGETFESASRLLQSIGSNVLDGEVYKIGETVGTDHPNHHFHIQPIDPRLWDGPMFNQWKNYFSWRRDQEPIDVTPSAVELVPCSKPTRPLAPNRATRRSRP